MKIQRDLDELNRWDLEEAEREKNRRGNTVGEVRFKENNGNKVPPNQ